MFLESWMVAVLAMVYGLCAVLNYKLGVKTGIYMCLQLLHKKKLINITEVDREILSVK